MCHKTKYHTSPEIIVIVKEEKGAGRLRMDPCERILAEMQPVIRAYHQGTWLTRARDVPPKIAEDLWREMQKRWAAQDTTSDGR